MQITIHTIDLGQILQPGSVFAWLLVGLIAGFLASTFVSGRGFGCLGDTIVGLIGAFIGGLIVNFLAPGSTFGFWGSVVVAVIGASVLITVLRVISGGFR
jgi:uncharacterized membrane protein YeaQ/YmgE (transglycosylase-associated protein family)